MNTWGMWQTIPKGLEYCFSPSGHALAYRPLTAPLTRTLRIEFVDGREPIIKRFSRHVTSLVWVSNSELVHQIFAPAANEKSMLCALSITDMRSRVITEVDDTIHVSWKGIPGHVSVLKGREGRNGLYDLDTLTGDWKRLIYYDQAFGRIMAYPLFGHSWSTQTQEVALIAWPYDYLEPDVEPDENNSHWLPILDTLSIQEEILIRKNGSKITQRELTRDAKKRKPPRIFLLNASGEFREIPGTAWARHPNWSPDGSMLSFEQPIKPWEVIGLVRRENLEWHSVDTHTTHAVSVMHPNGILFYKTGNNIEQEQPAEWRQLLLQHGETLPGS